MGFSIWVMGMVPVGMYNPNTLIFQIDLLPYVVGIYGGCWWGLPISCCLVVIWNGIIERSGVVCHGSDHSIILHCF